MTAIVLNAGPGSVAIVERIDTGISANTLYCLQINVTRNWVMFQAGTAAGLDNVIAATRLEPGTHVLSFTTSSAGGNVYYRLFRDQQGIAAVTSFNYLESNDLTLKTPYQENDLRSLRFEQSGDILWFFHPAYAWRGLERRNNRSWSFRSWRPIDGPFLPPNSDDQIALSASGVTGEVVLTSNKGLFDNLHVGALFQLTHVGQLRTMTVSTANQWTEAIRVTDVDANRIFSLEILNAFTGAITLQRSVGNEFSWTNYRTYSSPGTYIVDDTFDNQVIYYRAGIAAGGSVSAPVSLTLSYAGGITTGTARIINVMSPTTAVADVVRQLGGTGATHEWAEGAWSSLRGWPGAGALFDGRLWLTAGRALWASKPDDYLAFEAGPEDGDAINSSLAVGDISPPRWLIGAQTLLLGTEASELQIRSTSFDEPITPTNRSIRERSSRGSVNIACIRQGARVFFVSRSGQRLISLEFSGDSGGYVDADLTRLHQVIAGDNGFVALDIQQEPEPRLWLVRADGQCVVLTYNTQEQVVGFSRYLAAANGIVEDVCVLPGTPEDDVYLAIRRNGQVDVERVQKERWASLDDAWRLQSALKYEGSATSVLSGLNHLEGSEVGIWANGSEHPSRTVQNGSINLDRPVTKAIVGYAYTGRYKSPRLNYGGDVGGAVGEIKRLNAVTLLTYRTPRAALQIGAGWRFSRAPEITRQQQFDRRLEGKTEEIRLNLDAPSNSDPRLVVEMIGSGPATLLGYVIEMQTNSRNL